VGAYPAYQLTPSLRNAGFLEDEVMDFFFEIFLWDLDFGLGLELHASQVFLEVWLRRNGWGGGVQLSHENKHSRVLGLDEYRDTA
jgi:hypothetical protein